MKKLVLIIGVLIGTSIQAQTASNFDNLPIGTDTFWDGSDLAGGFTNGDAFFHNNWDTTWGFWLGGFAYSNVMDTVTAGASNSFAAVTYFDYSGTGTYGVSQNNSRIRLLNSASSNPVKDVRITNSTWAYTSIRDGDQFAKKFGGTSGNDPDWFKLTIKGYTGGSLTTDSVEFYLADFRFSNNSQDYIVKHWASVDLSPLGTVDSLNFALSSSDVGSFGMNTPGFFCIDNFNDATASVNTVVKETTLKMYPNPAAEFVKIILPIDTEGELQIIDLNGKVVVQQRAKELSNVIGLRGLHPGVYMVNVRTRDHVYQNKLIISQ